MNSYILLDRSGSMIVNWIETLTATNFFVEELAKKKPKTKITLAVFDSSGFDVIRDHVIATDWSPVNNDEVSPRSMTPLFDAISRLDNIVSGKKATVLILTDGVENASHEITLDGAKAIVEKWKNSGYDVTYIGADFDAFGQAKAVGIDIGQTLNTQKGRIGESMAMYSSRAVTYAKTGDNSAEWSKEDRYKAQNMMENI